MANFKDIFRITGRYIPEGDSPPEGLRRKNLNFLFGSVTHFNFKKQEISVDLFKKDGGSVDIPLTQPFAGTNSYISAVPDVGSVVLLCKVSDQYFVVTYLPTYDAALDSKAITFWDSDDIKNAGKNDYYFRYRRLHPGEIAISSSDGPEIHLNNNLKIDDGVGDSILIRNYDNSIINTSVNNYTFSGGVWNSAGIIYRNSLDDSNTNEGQFAQKEIDPEGKYQYPLVSNPKSESIKKYFTEFLLEVDEETTKTIPYNNVNSLSIDEERVPAAVFSLGNFVGNSPNKTDTYGKLLGVQLFKDIDDVNGQFNLTALSSETSPYYSLAVTILKPSSRNYNKGTFLGIDKEGHYYQYVQSASGGGLGSGRSISILADGSKKEQFGLDSDIGNSWDLNTRGGIRWIVGNHSSADDRYKEKSIDIRTSKSIFTYYGAPEEDLLSEYKLYEWDDIESPDKLINNTGAYKKIDIVNGRERKEIDGNSEAIVNGSVLNRIEGMREERITQNFDISVANNMNVVVSEVYSEVATQEKKETFGSRITTVTSGDSELIIDNKTGTGKIIEKIKFIGNKETTLKLGSIKEKITATGSREFETKIGDIEYKIIGAGNITHTTRAGNIENSTTAGNILYKTTGGNATLEAGIVTDIKGTKVNLKGRTPISGGVVTDKTHFDYITGATLKGSLTVSATS